MKNGNGKGLTLTLQTLKDDGTGKLTAIKPDRDGVYRGFPLGVYGLASNNDKCYDLESSMEATFGVAAPFGRGVEGGGREGEWGHPVIFQGGGPNDKYEQAKAMHRMLAIERAQVSHRIIGVGHEPLTNGSVLVRGDIKPSGPHRQLFIDEMADPSINLAMSLRAYIVPQAPNSNVWIMKYLVTFDAVATPGFGVASKRNMTSQVGTESYEIDERNIQFSVGSLVEDGVVRRIVATEELTEQELLDTLGVNRLFLCHENVGVYDASNNSILGVHPLVGAASPFHLCFGKDQDLYTTSLEG